MLAAHEVCARDGTSWAARGAAGAGDVPASTLLADGACRQATTTEAPPTTRSALARTWRSSAKGCRTIAELDRVDAYIVVITIRASRRWVAWRIARFRCNPASLSADLQEGGPIRARREGLVLRLPVVCVLDMLELPDFGACALNNSDVQVASMPWRRHVSSIKLAGQRRTLLVRDHPADHVAAEDIEDHVQVEVRPLLRPERVSSGRGPSRASSASRKGTLLGRPLASAECGPIWRRNRIEIDVNCEDVCSGFDAGTCKEPSRRSAKS